MKLVFELLTFLVLFVLFRGAIQRFLPKKAAMNKFSAESLKALRNYRLRYFQLLILFILIFGILIYLLLVTIKDQLNPYAADYMLFLPLKNSAFWQASLLGGLLLGSLLAFQLNRRMQRDGLSFYLEELQELVQGYQSFSAFRLVQYALGLILFAILSYSALSTGLGFKPGAMHYLHPWGQTEIKELKSIKKLDKTKSIQLVINKKDTIDLSYYKYDSKDLDILMSAVK